MLVLGFKRSKEEEKETADCLTQRDKEISNFLKRDVLFLKERYRDNFIFERKRWIGFFIFER